LAPTGANAIGYLCVVDQKIDIFSGEIYSQAQIEKYKFILKMAINQLGEVNTKL
jgi:hypothetical protein